MLATWPLYMVLREPENDHLSGSHLRNPASGTAGTGMCPKQYCRRLDFGKLVDRGVNVLRIGNPTRVNDKMLSFTYERRFENHPLYPELWSIRKISVNWAAVPAVAAMTNAKEYAAV